MWVCFCNNVYPPMTSLTCIHIRRSYKIATKRFSLQIQRNATQRNATQRNATQRNATQRNATQRNATQRNATQRNATQRNATQRNATQRNATQRNATQRNATQRNATQRNATQRNATQRNATQRNATQRNATQHNTTQHNTTQQKSEVLWNIREILIPQAPINYFQTLHPSISAWTTHGLPLITSPSKITTVLIRRNAPNDNCHNLTALMPRCIITSFLFTPHYICAHRNWDNLHNAVFIGYSVEHRIGLTSSGKLHFRIFTVVQQTVRFDLSKSVIGTDGLQFVRRKTQAKSSQRNSIILAGKWLQLLDNQLVSTRIRTAVTPIEDVPLKELEKCVVICTSNDRSTSIKGSVSLFLYNNVILYKLNMSYRTDSPNVI